MVSSSHSIQKAFNAIKQHKATEYARASTPKTLPQVKEKGFNSYKSSKQSPKFGMGSHF